MNSAYTWFPESEQQKDQQSINSQEFFHKTCLTQQSCKTCWMHIMGTLSCSKETGQRYLCIIRIYIIYQSLIKQHKHYERFNRVQQPLHSCEVRSGVLAALYDMGRKERNILSTPVLVLPFFMGLETHSLFCQVYILDLSLKLFQSVFAQKKIKGL